MAKGKRGYRDAKSLARSPAFRSEATRVLIVCEGAKTEPTYFHALRKDKGLTAVTVRGEGADPKGIVETARDVYREAAASGEPFDEVWCVFDRDDHQWIAEAINQAENQPDGNFHVAFSNPCFELWYLLHFGDSAGYVERAEVVRRLRRGDHLGAYEKAMNVYPLIEHKQADAVANAGRLRAHHDSANAGRPENPSTNVDELVTYLISLAADRSGRACDRDE
jgi:hypothetical protein